MIQEKKKILVLIDAHAVLHRAFHALPNFTSPQGEPTGALFGFASFILKIIRELKPDYMAACYDLPEPTFRHVVYEQYKAQRPKTDDLLAQQIGNSREMLKVFGIPVLESPGFEADDILGSIVNQLLPINDQLKIIIASGDLDTLQLVRNKEVVVYTLSKGIKETVLYDDEMVKKRFGFGPEFISDFKALKGDPSDNIIGVPGIGEKTASALIKKFGHIENLYRAIKEDRKITETGGLRQKTIEILKKNEEEAMFSKTLAEIRKDAPVKFSLEEGKWKKFINFEKIRGLFIDLSFKSLLDRLPILENKDSLISPKELLYEKLKGQVTEKFFYEIELPLFKILQEMESRGILLDTEYLKKISDEYHQKLRELEQKIWKMAGEKFNINSPKQLSEVLFKKLNLKQKGLKKTSTGNQSTSFSELIKLKNQHPVVEEIISCRELAKLTSTYLDTLPIMADENKRIHTKFDQAGTVTGRISSKDPNLQNIPKRTETGKKIRRAFIADNGFYLVSFDYSQIELRIMAILSRDEKLKNIFQEGEDVHSAVAAEIFNLPLGKVTEEMRRQAKVINFGIIYGMGINALKESLQCSREEAQIFYDKYFLKFKGVADYLERTKEEVRKNGYTETLFKRKRYFPEINSSIEKIRSGSERMAINAPVQGSAADFIKIAMVKIDKMVEEKEWRAGVRLLLQIHDELIFEIREEMIEKSIPVIKDITENIYPDDIPIIINVYIGKNWQDMIKYEYGKRNNINH
ncbi:MAG: DNA polymerase [Patescibacteria group bacterium]